MIDPALADTIRRNLEAVRSQIERAASTAGRPPSDVRLVAVSKTFSAEHVRAAAAAGQHEFGENKVQEALVKVAATADLALGWHFIGHVQSNKSRKAVGPFAMIHSVDSLALLQRLDKHAAEEGRTLDVLVQVDLAQEETKFGLAEDAVGPLLEQAGAHRWARIRGLMLVPPFSADAEASRPYFRRLAGLRARLLEGGCPAEHVGDLSMGMSHDFEVAIQEGATIVRIGTAIFGSRKAAAPTRDSPLEP